MGKTRRKLKAGSRPKTRCKTRQRGGNISMGNPEKSIITDAKSMNHLLFIEKYTAEKLEKIFYNKYTSDKRFKICRDIKLLNKKLHEYGYGEPNKNLNYIKGELKQFTEDHFVKFTDCFLDREENNDRVRIDDFDIPMASENQFVYRNESYEPSNYCIIDKKNNITLSDGDILNLIEHGDNRMTVKKENDNTAFDINYDSDYCKSLIKPLNPQEPSSQFDNEFYDKHGGKKTRRRKHKKTMRKHRSKHRK